VHLWGVRERSDGQSTATETGTAGDGQNRVRRTETEATGTATGTKGRYRVGDRLGRRRHAGTGPRTRYPRK